jgi:hypothetical protein
MAWWGNGVWYSFRCQSFQDLLQDNPLPTCLRAVSPLVRNTIDSRARVLVLELLLCLIPQSLQLGILLGKLLVILELLQEVDVCVWRGTGEVLSLLDCRAVVYRLPPLFEVLELAEVNAREVC